MRGTMNVITHLARTMNERLDAMAEVERYRMKLGIYGAYDMRCTVQRLTPSHGWHSRVEVLGRTQPTPTRVGSDRRIRPTPLESSRSRIGQVNKVSGRD
ncbi:hypothetical protein Taro_015316 [Colocasia esculenta]|uniref:Uncharacterized protein n=1 Tax=Colocasia esculenta TaxID=4460 RepID=A0A843UH72_COLES|nr:hypothetical protein [Colocasia esculenta]